MRLGAKVGNQGMCQGNAALTIENFLEKPAANDESVSGPVYYYRARYYDPESGRFITEDPLKFNSGEINHYVYCGNNPINCNDPSGNIAFVVPLITGGIGSAAGAVGSAVGQVISNGGLDNFSFSEVGVAAGVGFAAGAAAPFTATTLVGAAITGGVANVAQLGVNEAIDGNLRNISVGDVALAGATGLAGGAIGGSFTRSTGLRFSETSQFIDPSLARQLNISSDLAGSTAGSSLLRNVGGAVASNLNFEGSTFDILSIANANPAGGGFVLYPNKPNTNMLQSVYAK